MSGIQALLVEDDDQHAAALISSVQQVDGAEIQVTRVPKLTQAVNALVGDPFDVVLLDLTLPDAGHLEPVWVMRREAPRLPIVVMTGHDDDEIGFEAVQAGAQDYIVKSQVAGSGLVRVIRYAIERQRALNEAMALSFLDTLTGLHNRRGFVVLAEHHLRIATRSQRPMLVLFVDLDGLKSINDDLGHQHGDAALAEAAAVLRETFRDTDLIARLGGDEFAVLAIEAADQTAEVLATRLQSRIVAHNLDDGRDYQLSMSVGLCHFDPVHPLPVEDLLHQADSLMYAEKSRKHAQREGS